MIYFIHYFLEDIHPAAFSRFELKTLKIMHELKSPNSSVKNLLDNLQNDGILYIHLSCGSWSYLPTDLFQRFTKTNANYLYLDGNKFRYVNCSTFYTSTKTDETLNKWRYDRENYILWYAREVLQNRLKRISNWCKDRKRKISSVPKLKDLYLDGNMVGNMGRETYQCLPKSLHLNLNDNRMGKIQSNVFSSMPLLQTCTDSSSHKN